VDQPALTQRTALVTGAARGIGRATVEALAAAGWRVFAGGREPDRLEPFTSANVEIIRLDVTDPEMVRSAVSRAESRGGGALGCVVNNAGWALFGAIEDVDLDVARREFETNLLGAIAVLQAALPGMRRSGSGVVVSDSTLTGRVPLPLFGMYSATKLSLAAGSEAVALELGPSGIRVVLLEAGVVRTEFARSTVISGSAGEAESVYAPKRDRLLGSIRAIRQESGIPAEDVAAAIVQAVEDEESAFRVLIHDEGLGRLADAVGGPAPDSHDQVRTALGLKPPTTPSGST
jgi:NAD(P)-dependent dehydrogenase (short-subunit alcohol dehydrogenase family)